MIDKKEVVSWFKELESYKRIDAMYTLIGMCLPFELRFLGSVLEELGRRDSQELRGIELRVNNPQELAADIASCQNGEPTDKKIRRKMAIYLALIRACSRSCVNELFKTLEGWGDMDFVKFGDVENTLEELLLVYTMASLHPVFSYDQRNKCADILAKIEDSQKLLHSSQQHQQQQHHPHQQQTQTVQHEQQHGTAVANAAAASPMVQGHMVAGHQHMHAQMQVLPSYHYAVQQPPIPQMIHTDSSVSHQIPADIPFHPTLGIPTEYTVGAPPPPIWTIRPGIQSYTPQQPPSIDPHPPQSPSPMLSQQSSPSHSRTASPSRSSGGGGGNTIMQQQQTQQQQHNRNSQQQQQQQQQSQRNNTLRNSRRPSVETTPPPTMQQQAHQLPPSQLIIPSDMIPPYIKNLDDIYNPDGTLALQCRNGYTRSGHHTIPRQSKSSHHNQQQQQHHNQHLPNMTSLIGIGSGLVGGGGGVISPSPLQQSGGTTTGSFNAMNAANLTYQLHNMGLSDNPAATAAILENNIVISSTNSNSSSNRHHNKSGESDSGNSIGSSVGEISPPDTPAALSSVVVNNSNMSSNSSLRINDQNNFSKHNLNMTRLNGRPDKLLAGSGVGLVDAGVISSSIGGGGGGGTTVLYAHAPNSSQQQQFIGNELILATGPNLMPSPIANNNNNSNLSSTGNSGSCSNNNLVTSTQVMLTTPTAGSGVVSNVITTNPVILQHQQQFSATYPYPAQHLPTTRPPILPHNTAAPAAGIPPPPLPYRHPGFQIPNGEPPTAVYQYPAQVAGGAGFLLGGAATQPPSGVMRSSQPSQSQSQAASQQQQQQSQQPLPPQGAPQQPSIQPVAPSTLLAANTSPYTTLTVGTAKVMSCFNCGSQTHTGRDCQEASMEDVTRSIYKLDYSQSISPTTPGASHAGGGGVTSNSSNSSSSSSSSSGGGGSGSGSGVSTAEIATETSSPTSSSSSLSNSNIK
ncbi:unnamed protein product [Hermetia illucens]|uniref:CCHC-type domain-containing protein n=1 Tax=Hermetia illucens TaxID=343691 RepID=A0A7R8UUC4_HERIL|nr:unnamed protein product [Hermetia illucens]